MREKGAFWRVCPLSSVLTERQYAWLNLVWLFLQTSDPLSGNSWIHSRGRGFKWGSPWGWGRGGQQSPEMAANLLIWHSSPATKPTVVILSHLNFCLRRCSSRRFIGDTQWARKISIGKRNFQTFLFPNSPCDPLSCGCCCPHCPFDILIWFLVAVSFLKMLPLIQLESPTIDVTWSSALNQLCEGHVRNVALKW